MAAFTHYWTNDTYENALAHREEGGRLTHTAGNQFSSRGVKNGDQVYVITVMKGQLYLIGRMTVSAVVHSQAEAARLLGTDDLWVADDHLIATDGECTEQFFGRQVPLALVKKLTFESTGRARTLKFKSSEALDQQTLRGVRKLTRSSVQLLDSILKQ